LLFFLLKINITSSCMIRNEFHTLNYTTFAGKVKCNMQDGK
jgi:hypothetical protein